jgi:hypothetical protein
VVLATKLEAAAHAASQDLKTFIVTELDKHFGAVDKRFGDVDKNFGGMDRRLTEMESRMNVRFAEQEARFERTLRVHLATILTTIVGAVGIIVAVLKFFPAGH